MDNPAISRHSFSKTKHISDIPDLLSLQIYSWEDFLQEDVLPEKRENKGLEAVFKNIFPVEDNHKNYLLEYKSYYLGLPKYSVKECLERRISYAVPLKVKFVLHITDENDKSNYVQSIEQDVFFGNIPYMTESGTFIINGAERIVVSQLQRSPGVFFDQSVHPNGTKIHTARIIPFRGSWVDFSTDIYDCMYAIIDRRRKFPATLLLRAIGISTDKDIFDAFGMTSVCAVSDKKILNNVLVEDIVDKDTGEVVFESGALIDEDCVKVLKKNKIKSISIVDPENNLSYELLINTMKKDPTSSFEEAVILLYKHLRTGDSPNIEIAAKFIEKMFFSTKKYDLGAVGRYRINKKFGLDNPIEDPVLTKEDFIEVFKYLIKMRIGEKGADDIDHLGNRRVRTVGEQLANQFSVSLSRMQRTIRERMSQREAESLTPQDLVNSRVVTTVLNTFFGTSQLSQFMDQTNPLSEITHKRRISSLGPGGLSRERAGFEVRDVHYTHYGRLCPIETPEGPNIGLINSLACHAIVNKLGFIESPYREIESNKNSHIITDNVYFLSPDEEDRSYIAQASEATSKNKFTNKFVRVRNGDDFPVMDAQNVNYMDVSPTQIVSVSAALIPFLENDDANRALMGSNMMRQSVPLMNPEPPIVATGMESLVAKDSRAALYSTHDGEVNYVDANKISIKTKGEPEELELMPKEKYKEYSLRKFLRTNQNTCINQRPTVNVGDKVKKGSLLADGHSTFNGELSLGRNLKVAYMPWRGYNFEDAIIINERLVKEDILTSIHIKESEVEIRDTKRGEEELTPEIPNVSDEATKNLDDRGIVRVGAIVKSGDILVGKVTPKGETDPTAEEKLLRAIFGEKAGDVKDASKRCNAGVNGVIVENQLFQRKSLALRSEEKKIIRDLQKEARQERFELISKRDELLKQQLIDELCGGIRCSSTNKTLVKAKTLLNKQRISKLDFEEISLKSPWVESPLKWQSILRIWKNYRRNLKQIEEGLEKRIFKLRVGDDLQQGVMKLAKVYIAQKRKVSIGDKMAGRHGNKGIVSIIVPEEDMPFMDNGEAVDIILNPLGVPSRMNLGQLYETMLGWAGSKLRKHYSTPVFDGASHDDVVAEMKKAGIPRSGKVYLYDGKTGEKIDNPVVVGTSYMLKLSHLIDDKMHSRSTGPYSLITQQPLGGKAQSGGQRFGEMEVWALEAYGAAHTLQEILTVKSDDVHGRTELYNALVRGENPPEANIPESFNVLVKELEGLGLNVILG
ncbi:MAG: DNA-directed RNA polymerase subunit beta [Candidatus Marinimicrobia bacterium]|nr:DNA-directed RNA polymerase subunit beta [Candidatus Neomarinimicrobiota bacterium]|tara:strand:+ start:267 stop:4022 length:3756 start_codon:yes stop_codon:yes gene_type:complete